MVASKYIAVVAAAFASVASASAVEGDWALALLKRQQPGTPAYACHEACGNSITLSRGASPCTDDSFLSNYAACLACAGPDNINIWRYYGATLSAAGTRCGLSTTPASGSSGGGSSSTTSSAAAASSTPAATSQAPSTTTAAPAETSTPVSPPSSPVSEPPAAGTTASQTASAIPSSSTVAALPTTTTAGPSGTLPASNGTASTTSSSSLQFTGGAASHQQIIGWGAVGAAVLAIFA